MEQREASQTRNHYGSNREETPPNGDVWADLHLAGLVEVANVDEEDIVVYSAKRQPLCAARCLVAYFLELLRQVWESRLCLTHMDPILEASRPALVSALKNFDIAHANFQLPPSSQRCGLACNNPSVEGGQVAPTQ